MKRHIELFIFDLDGTLVDSSRDIANAVNHSLRLFNRSELPKEVIVGFVGDGLRTLMKRCFPGEGLKQIRKAEKAFRAYYTEHLLDETVLYRGVPEVLEYCRSKVQAVASNKPAEFVLKILNALGISGYFSVILGGDSVDRKKPFPDQVMHILKETGISSDRALFVGDGVNDFLAARESGVLSCYLNTGFNKGSDLGDMEPDYVLDDILQIKEYFQ